METMHSAIRLGKCRSILKILLVHHSQMNCKRNWIKTTSNLLSRCLV